jgi:predicted PurR-regulated permease PerM
VSARIPLDKNIRTIVAETVEATAISVVVASIAAATVQAAIMVLSFLVLNVPGAFLAGGMTFILAWVPIFGSTPVWLFGAGYLYANGHISSAVMMIIAGLITGTIDNFVRPMILKGRGEMNPLISLVAIFGGLQMFGLFGVFIGPIMLAVVVSLLQIWPRVAKSFGLRFDEEV